MIDTFELCITEFWVRSIGANPNIRTEVGVATSNGKAYYRITTLLKRMGVPFADVVIGEESVYALSRNVYSSSTILSSSTACNLKAVVTTRRERLLVPGSNVICIEDLGDDSGLAKQKLLDMLYPPRAEDRFVIGIDPGERTGFAAFVDHREIESTVFSRLEDVIERAAFLARNASQSSKFAKIGAGNPALAKMIARRLRDRLGNGTRIQLVDERGTSLLTKARRTRKFTRDQRAARLIAFREGKDFSDSKWN